MEAIWAQRNVCQRIVSHRRPHDRRFLPHPVDVHGHPQSSSVAVDDDHGVQSSGSPVHGLLGDLRAGYGESESTGVYSACAGWRQLPMERRIPARDLPGDAGFRCSERSAKAGSISVESAVKPGPAAARTRFDPADEPAISGRSGESARNSKRRFNPWRLRFTCKRQAPEVFDIRKESKTTLARYGDGDFARGCLMARRLVEAGVRMVQVYYGVKQEWDQHEDIMGHKVHARKCDPAIAALIQDLKERGLAGRYAGDRRHRIRTHAGGQPGRIPIHPQRARSQPLRLFRATGRRRREAWPGLRGDGRLRFQGCGESEFTCMTCTPRVCICSVSITKS